MARGLDPLAPPDWPYAHGNRFDDPGEVDGVSPEARFRVVYCASERVCAFAETVARFRPNLRALAGIRAASDDPGIASVLRPGLITEDWRLKRRVGTIVLDPPLRFVDIADAKILAALRDVFAPLAVALGLPDFDLSAVTSAHRLLTQRIARHIYEQTTDAGAPRFAGIRYPSRLGGGWTCWVVFSTRIRGVRGPVEAIFPDDPGLRAAANLFGLSIESLNGAIIPPQRAT